MKAALPAILVVLLVGLVAALYFRGGDADLSEVVDDHAPTVRIDATGRPVLEQREAVPDAERPVPAIRYRVVDAESGAPVGGCRVLRARDGTLLGTTDADGVVGVEGAAINAVVFAADGFLLEHFFDREAAVRSVVAGLRRDGVARILLRRDDLTVRFRLEFRAVDGSVPAAVRFRVACLDSPAPDGRAVPGDRMGAGVAIEPELRAAWRRHLLLATLQRPVFATGFLHFGGESQATTYSCPGTAAMRFVAVGGYRVEAEAGGEFRRQTIDVIDGGAAAIQLRAGGTVAGQVVSRRGQQPIAQAGVALFYNGSIVVSDLTDAQGRFELGPVAPNAMRLQIHHPAYQALELHGVRPGGPPVVHQLTGLPEHPVRGVVRRRPGRQPVPDARVRLVSGDGVAAEARTDAQGRFELQSYLIEPTVEIEATGFLAYGEALNANGELRDFDLIPATVDERVQAGLTALVTGKVLDAEGRPAANRPVHVQPVNPAPAPGFDGRRILRGGRLVQPMTATSGPDGGFTLEWPRSEAVRLLAVHGIPQPGQGTVVDAIVGRRQQVVLRDPR